MGMTNFYVAGRAEHRDSKLDDVKLADLQDELGPTHLDELGLFNGAGIETLTTACSAIMFLLSMHPDVQNKVLSGYIISEKTLKVSEALNTLVTVDHCS